MKKSTPTRSKKPGGAWGRGPLIGDQNADFTTTGGRGRRDLRGYVPWPRAGHAQQLAIIGLVYWNDGLEDVAALRSLRATPPGLASSGRREKTFGAALEQLEQLLTAAKLVPPQSAPILLFYALAQGGRAILAAHERARWEIHGHGLSARPQRDPIGETSVAPSGAGLFQAVAAATGSPSLDCPMTLSQIWGRIPSLRRAPGLGLEEPQLFAVTMEPQGGRRRVIRDDSGSLLRDPAQFTGLDLAPEITTADMTVEQQGEFAVVSLEFADDSALELFDALLAKHLGASYLRASAGAGSNPSALMMWWILLMALSQLARYEPAGWTHALMPDRSALTVPIEDMLRRAARLLPRLVLDALVSVRSTEPFGA